MITLALCWMEAKYKYEAPGDGFIFVGTILLDACIIIGFFATGKHFI